MNALIDVSCPSCGEVFAVLPPAASETPCEVDYDCEVCCRPMVIAFWHENDAPQGCAHGLDD